MLNLSLLFVYSTLFSLYVSSDFSVNLELLQPITREEIKVKIEVKNLSEKAATVFKYRRQDYKREKIRALGNYVVEIEKFEINHYSLFTPSADINPIFENQEYITLRKGDGITDTLYIDGFSFSRPGEPKRGFPQGKYRLRIYFNSNMSNCNESNGSNWTEFKIE